METTEMTQLVFYISILVCAAIAVYFLRGFLSNRRLRASLWWATGFLLFAFGILAMTVATVYGFHRILVVLTFAFVAASVTFLYYAASLLFFSRKSFFREKFAVILFAVSVFLFSLPVYLSEEHTAEIMRSSMIALFAVAFLVIAVLFSLFNQVARPLRGGHPCRTLGALQSLAWWIIAVWSLCFALFWGSIIVIGSIFGLSSFEFILLLYGCKGGDIVKIGKEDYNLNVQKVNGIKNKIKLDSDRAQMKLDEAMLKIDNVLLMLTIKEEKHSHNPAPDPKKFAMVTHISTIGLKEGKLELDAGKLANNSLNLLESLYSGAQPLQKDEIPFGQMALHKEILSNKISTNEINNLATLTGNNSSTNKNVIEECCDLVISVCNMGRYAVTEEEWDGLPSTEHPGGMIGHTYNILHVCDEKATPNTAHAEDFRNEFQGDANEYLGRAENLETEAENLKNGHGTPPSEGDATSADEFLQEAIELLQDAQTLVNRASDFVNNLP